MARSRARAPHLRRVGENLGSGPQRRPRRRKSVGPRSVGQSQGEEELTVRWDVLEQVRPNASPHETAAHRLIGGFLRSVGKVQAPRTPERDVVREWRAQWMSVHVFGCVLYMAFGVIFGIVGLVHAISPTSSLSRVGGLILVVAGLASLAVGARSLVLPVKRVLLYSNQTLSFVGWRRRLDVPPNQLKSITGWPLVLDLGQRFPWRVSAVQGNIRLAPRIRDGQSLVSAIRGQSPGANLSRGFIAFVE